MTHILEFYISEFIFSNFYIPSWLFESQWYFDIDKNIDKIKM